MLFGERLLDDQIQILDGILVEIKNRRPDALLIAGDVFDRSVPPSDAVEALDNFLVAVVSGLKTPVVLIPGNHDSADRLGFGARLSHENLHIVSALDRVVLPLRITDAHGPIDIYGLPFLEPARVAQFLDKPDIKGHQDATAAMVDTIRQAQSTARNVLVAHAFVSGGKVCDSERALSIGGADTVDVSAFAGFSAVALGHLHRPQYIGNESVQYAGSPMRYSTSELGYTKSISQIDIDGSGSATVTRIPLSPPRDLVLLEGTLEALITEDHSANHNDFVVARLTDKGPVYGAMARLRQRWPNALHIERVYPDVGTPTQLTGLDHRKQSVQALFEIFFEDCAGEPLSAPERAAFLDILSETAVTEEGA
jgi:exonuclease SbcD